MRRRNVFAATGALALLIWLGRRFPRLRPFTVVVSSMELLPPQVRSRAHKQLFKALYFVFNRGMSGAGSGFLNYGYAPTTVPAEHLELPPEREPDRYGIQLYDRVAGAVELRGLDVLEVGCGRGGGTSFVFERHQPASMTGLDLSELAIAHCRRTYGRPGLQFVAGDAENLPFPDGSFDAVVNVESSHSYPDMARFLAEVVRVLRPGGFLLFADLRHTRVDGAHGGPRIGDVARLRDQIAAAGFEVVEEEDISANVARALELDTPRRRALIEENVPRIIQSQVLDFVGVEGSGPHRSLAGGDVTYLRFALRSPSRETGRSAA
jgi:SAM-dependent methyltransferase